MHDKLTQMKNVGALSYSIICIMWEMGEGGGGINLKKVNNQKRGTYSAWFFSPPSQIFVLWQEVQSSWLILDPLFRQESVQKLTTIQHSEWEWGYWECCCVCVGGGWVIHLIYHSLYFVESITACVPVLCLDNTKYPRVMGCGLQKLECWDAGCRSWSDGMRCCRSDRPGLCLEWWGAMLQAWPGLCFIVIKPRALSASRVDLDFYF